MSYTISREIGIDMGHRVTHHGSKCKSVHGHRYTIEAHCRADDVPTAPGEQQGMVLDFGFLKDVMTQAIDAPFDHALCLWVDDPLVSAWGAEGTLGDDVGDHIRPDYFRNMLFELNVAPGRWTGGRLVLVNVVPTAENLAMVWFHEMTDEVLERSGGRARLTKVVVWETPNCCAVYEP